MYIHEKIWERSWLIYYYDSIKFVYLQCIRSSTTPDKQTGSHTPENVLFFGKMHKQTTNIYPSSVINHAHISKKFYVRTIAMLERITDDNRPPPS